MKKIIFALSAVALMVGCANEPVETPIELEKTTTVTVEVTPEQQTRTYTEGNKIYWDTTGEQLNIIYFADESTNRRQSATHADYTLTDNKATFTADLTTTDGATKYTLGAFYPYAYKSTTSSISLTVPQEQTPSATSYDPKADILVSKNPVVSNGLPDKLTFEFARMVAFAKMTIKGIPAGEKIEKVVFSSSAKPAGAVEFKVHEQGTLDNANWYNNYEDITLNLGGREATGEDTVWFVTVPTDLSDADFTVEVTTNKNIYTKTVDLTGKTLKFERADIAQFSVSGLTVVEKPKAYKLLTDAKELTVGDTFVICTKKAASSTAQLLSTVADGGALKFTSSMTVTDALEIVEVPADAAVMTVEAGVEAGTIACKAAEGYLYGNYDSENWSSKLYFKDTKDEEGSWELNLSSSYAATLYNETHGRYLNNYYGSKFNFAGSQGTYYYYIYYIDGEGSGETPDVPEVTPLATPVVSATASGNTITATWAAIDGAKDYTVTCGSQSQTVATTTATFEGLEYKTEYTISVVANPADEAVNGVSEAGTTKATTEADPNASTEAQTITLSFPENFPAGAASGNSVGTIYSGDVIISSTGSWRTDKENGRDCIYIGRTTSGELRIDTQNNGKTITKVILTSYAGYYVDLKAKADADTTTTTFKNATTAEWTGECKKLVFTPAGNSHSNIATITVVYK